MNAEQLLNLIGYMKIIHLLLLIFGMSNQLLAQASYNSHYFIESGYFTISELREMELDENIISELFDYYNFEESLRKHISNRFTLNQVDFNSCNESTIEFKSSPASSNRFHIIIKKQNFQKDLHDISTRDDEYGNPVILIDGTEFYGTSPGNLPETEISSIRIILSENEILIPESAYSDLYNPSFCSNDILFIEAYESVDQEYLYVYMSGSDAGGSYDVKWIFSHEEYVGRLVAPYLMKGFYHLDGLMSGW